MILPGATLGMMGGGQLGRMFVLEALRLGYRVVVFDPAQVSPAGLVSSYHICAAYDDTNALDELIELCDAVTIEFENIPLKSLEYLEQRISLSPSANSVRIAQDRLLEKSFFQENALTTPKFAPIHCLEDIPAALKITGTPCIIKTARFGYDGKGQAVCHDEESVAKAFEQMDRTACIVEQKIDLAREVSVIMACGRDGRISAFPVAENTHLNGILDTTVVPAALEREQAAQVMDLAKRLAAALDYVGVLAVELFISTTGEVLVNEIAPRPHNSGHFSQDATDSSQFEQQLRMMCDLPAASTALSRQVVMLNLLGDLWAESRPNWQTVFEIPGACLHLYGKHEARPGRKMGHINLLGDDRDALLAQARSLKVSLQAS
ncbi:MAG: 5-(carboxyamino)imidazole ribonucleotide synthase [Gammaproteobacteria bacterium]|nr:5-(carboxyamino)imidazole ribonucleotide synthase [Gammaproteobacteria bacterium]